MVKKTLKLGMLLLLGLALGLPWGIMRQREYIHKESVLGKQAEEDMVDTFAKMQFVYADPQRAREALHDAISVHEKMQLAYPGWEQVERAKWGFCYGDLAILEETAGNRALAQSYMAKALELLKQSDYSEDGVRQALERHARERASAGGSLP